MSATAAIVYHRGSSTLYLAEECPPQYKWDSRPAKLEDFTAGLMLVNGEAISTTRQGRRIEFFNDKRRAVVELPEVDEVRRAAESLAAFFNGAIVVEQLPLVVEPDMEFLEGGADGE